MTKVRFFSDVSHSHRGGRGSSQDWACKKFTSKYSFEKKRVRSDFRIGVPCIIQSITKQIHFWHFLKQNSKIKCDIPVTNSG